MEYNYGKSADSRGYERFYHEKLFLHIYMTLHQNIATTKKQHWLEEF